MTPTDAAPPSPASATSQAQGGHATHDLESVREGLAAGPLGDDVPPGAHELFGAEVERAARYAELLRTRGVEWGLIGPHEVDRIWERHVLNSVAVADAVPEGASVVDVGSGAGLPGIPLALARPDLTVTLLEPLQRRAVFLGDVAAELELAGRVKVVRGRAMAEDQKDPLAHRETYDVVTCRAVAALPKLLTWCTPLLGRRGRLVALKGASAADEVAGAAQQLRKAKLDAEVVTVVPYEGAEPTHLIVCTRR